MASNSSFWLITCACYGAEIKILIFKICKSVMSQIALPYFWDSRNVEQNVSRGNGRDWYSLTQKLAKRCDRAMIWKRGCTVVRLYCAFIIRCTVFVCNHGTSLSLSNFVHAGKSDFSKQVQKNSFDVLVVSKSSHSFPSIVKLLPNTIDRGFLFSINWVTF